MEKKLFQFIVENRFDNFIFLNGEYIILIFYSARLERAWACNLKNVLNK